MTFSYQVVNTVTGEPILPVSVAAGSWGRALNGSRSGSHRLVVSDGLFRQDIWRGLTVPLARTLVVSWDGVAVYAGLITDREFNGDGTVTVSHSDVRWLLSDRYPFGDESYAGGTLVCINLTWRSIIARVVQRGIQGIGGIYFLPLGLPLGTEQGTKSKTFYNYNFASVRDILDEIQSSEDGPDTDFEPLWNSGGWFEWNLRVGSAAAPQLSGGLLEFNMTTPQPAISDLSVKEDSARQVTGVFVVGEGSEVDMVVGGGGGPEEAATIPARDVVQTRKTAKSEGEAGQFARAAVKVLQFPTEQWSFTLHLNELSPERVARVRLGATVRLYFKGHVWITDGWHELRLIGFSGDTSDKVKAEFQPVRA